MRKLSDEVVANIPELIRIRRQVHQYPELGFKEYRTAKLIARKLKEFGIAAKTGVAKTGVVGLIRGAKMGKTLLMRADIDGLPVTEQNRIPYKSKNPGVMHA